MKKNLGKIVLTISLLLTAFSCFYFPRSIEITETLSANPLIQQKTDNTGFIKLIQYIGLFCLVYSVWIWRRLLKISTIAFIGGNGVQIADPESIDRSFHQELQIQNTTSQTKSKYEIHKRQEQKDAIVKVMNESYTSVTRISILSSMLNLPKDTVEKCLFELQMEGIVRKDIVPGTLIGNYSLKDSWINRAIDNFKNRLIQNEERVISDLRYVRTKHNREIDAIIETDQNIYLVEIKSISKHIDASVIERGIKQLLLIEEDYKSQKPVQLELLFVLHKDFNLDIDTYLKEFIDIKENLNISAFRLE
ncbi:MAG: NERD domain-containing protein [Bacteroidales bacterium]